MSTVTVLSGSAQGHSRYGLPFCRRPKADICPQSFSKKVYLSHCLGSYRVEPTITRAEFASAGTLNLRGAPICCVSAIWTSIVDFVLIVEFGGTKNLLDMLTQYINLCYFGFIAVIHHLAIFHISLGNTKLRSL